MNGPVEKPLIAIACGGTGGHLFPGMTVGRELVRRGCDVILLVSEKEVDQLAVRCLTEMDVARLSAVGLQGRNYLSFLRAMRRSVREARRLFRQRRPVAVLAMGGFTAVAPMMAGRLVRAKLFLHESNAVPGRANRLLAPWVKRAFVGFREAADRLSAREITLSGTPVRECFQSVVPETCRRVLELDPCRPTLLVTGGSQGARGLNRLVMDAMPALRRQYEDLQFLWLAGGNDVDEVRTFCREHRVPAKVRRFLPEMELAYGAATVSLSRSGAASLAETAAMRVPVILVPLPGSADDHQRHNAMNFERTGAARLLEQETAAVADLVKAVGTLLTDTNAREAMREAQSRWHRPDAACLMADRMLAAIGPARKVDAAGATGATLEVLAAPLPT